MSKRINWAAKRLAPTTKPPAKCTDAELKKIIATYSDYLDAMCDEDGYVNTYERTADRVNPWFVEAERRGIK